MKCKKCSWKYFCIVACKEVNEILVQIDLMLEKDEINEIA